MVGHGLGMNFVHRLVNRRNLIRRHKAANDGITILAQLFYMRLFHCLLTLSTVLLLAMVYRPRAYCKPNRAAITRESAPDTKAR